MPELGLLLQPSTSLFKHSTSRRNTLDDLRVTVAHVPASPPAFGYKEQKRVLLGGTGTGLSFLDAMVPALSEALERHCVTSFSAEQVLWTSAQALGSRAVDLTQFPQCSVSELSSANCLSRPISSTTPIRWVAGLSLQSGRELYLPLPSVYIAPPICDAERFLPSISTGCAVHNSYEAALSTAILEACERDALSLAWLQKLPLPQIVIENFAETLGPLWTLLQRSSEHIRYFFLDATTELGIPTVLGVRTSPYNKRLHTIVSCASSLNVVAAIRKVVLELASFAMWLRKKRTVPSDFQDFSQLHHGPTYMGQKQHAHVFDFLTHNGRFRRLEDCQARVPASGPADPQRNLEYLLTILTEHNIEAYAVDLSTEEAVRAGLFAVRVVIPQLMPFSWIYRSRFLAHPRLYSAPAAMGYIARPERDLNIWPYPFG